MLKKASLAAALISANLGFSQIFTPNGGVSATTSPLSPNIGIGTNAPKELLDVRGYSTFGIGLTKSFFNFQPTPDQRMMILSGDSTSVYGFGSYWAASASTPVSNQILGVYGFAQSRKGTNGTTANSGSKAGIVGYSAGNGGTNSGYGGEMSFVTTGDNTGVIAEERMRIKSNGFIGIGTPSPSEQLHTTAGVRFQGLTVSNQSMIISIDANGKLYKTTLPSSGITNACITNNYIPKTLNGGNLTCSQIFDDGTSVGIGTNTGFAYTWSGGLTGTTPPPASGNVKLYINGVSKALAYFATSDQKFKKDITKIDNALDIIKKLEGKTYYWRVNEFREKGFNTVKQYGFIAQELEKVVPEAVVIDQNGDRSVNYDMIIPILVQGTKEQLLVIDNLQKQISELKSLVQAVLTNSGNTTSPSQAVNLSDKNVIVLNQNVPNPFSESTVITCNIPADFHKAQLHFHTSDGKLIKTIDITTTGQNTLNVFANDLSSGIYSYSLIIDEKVIETKRMIKQ